MPASRLCHELAYELSLVVPYLSNGPVVVIRRGPGDRRARVPMPLEAMTSIRAEPIDAGESSAHHNQLLKGMAIRLRQLRLERGYRLADIATMAGLSEPFLSRIEQGQRLPSLAVLLKLGEIYGVSAAALLQEPPPTWSAHHRAAAVWTGTEETGTGRMFASTEDGLADFPYDRRSRLEPDEERGFSNPEQLIGMAIAGCFSMSLAQELSAEGFVPRRVETSSVVELASTADDIAIRKVGLTSSVSVSDITLVRLREIAEHTRRSCVVSRALAAVDVTVETALAD